MNPAPIVLSPSVMLDQAIGNIAAVVDNVAWMTNTYGRAEKRERMRENARILYPAIYTGSGEYLKLFPDERLGNFAFFDVLDGYRLERLDRIQWRLEANISLIVWCDLRRVLQGNYDERSIENAKQDVFTALNAVVSPFTRFTVTRIWDRSENIYRGYTSSEIENQYLMRPYGGFRFEGELIHQAPCP